jgi:hypothetical protein
MNASNLHPGSKAMLIGLATCGLLAAIAFILLSGSDSSGASSSASADQLSVLEPAAPEAKEALPEKARLWLESVESSSLPGLKGEQLDSLGTASTSEGDVVVAGVGQNVCAYSVEHGVSNCGTLTLIEEGKLFVVVPNCPSPLIMGVLPDGFSSVHVGAGDKADGETDIPVSSNIYISELANSETELSGISDSGQSFKVEVPFGQISAPC